MNYEQAMKDIFEFDFRDSIRKVVRRELKEKFGIKPNKEKLKPQSIENTRCSGVFGSLLENVPSRNINEETHRNVPIFLIDAFEYLNGHLKMEGLFRKSGSVGRQKVLREIIERDGTFTSCEFLQPHDIASLVKQFFRELPDPLLTTRLSPAFLKCISTSNSTDCISALVLCTLLLPDVHLRVLQYFVKFISQMANHSLESKMTLSNLAIVLSPNLVSTTGKDRSSERSMKEITQIVDLLFKNSHLIGMVPDALLNKAINMKPDDGGFLSSSGDELEDDNNLKRGRLLQRSVKKRDRSRSITGFLRRNFKAAEKGTPKHGRSRTCEKPSTACNDDTEVPIVKEFGDPIWKNATTERAVKRQNDSKTNMSPVRKSPRLGNKPPIISYPKIQHGSDRIATMSKGLLQPVQNGSCDEASDQLKSRVDVLPSKFAISRTKQHSNNKNNKLTTSASVRDRKTKGTSLTVPCANSRSSLISRSVSSITSRSKMMQVDIDVCDDKRTSTCSGDKPCRAGEDENSGQEKNPSPTGTPHSTKISRATQKPHVRKNRRASSMDRRRARYASTTPARRQPPKRPDTNDGTTLNGTQASIRDESSANIAFISSRIHDNTTKENDRMSVLIECNAPAQTVADSSASQNEKISGKTTRSMSKRRLPKSSSLTVCISPSTSVTQIKNNENASPVTPTDKRLSCSSIRKPATPYSVTPQVGTRRSNPVHTLML